MANESAIVRSALYKTLQTTLANTSSVLLFTNNDTNNLFNFTMYVACTELNARIDITNETANMFVNSSNVSGSVIKDNNKYYLVIANSKTLTSPIIKKDINSINDISKIDFTSKSESTNSTSSTTVLISFESGQKAQFGSGVVFNNNLKFNNDVEINSIDAKNNAITVTSANINVTKAINTDTITAPNITVGETKTSADGKVTTTTTGTLTVHDSATTTTLNVTGTSTFGNIAVDGNSSTSKITLGTQDITGLATGAFRTSFTETTTLTKIYIAFPLNTLKERYNTANKTSINTFELMTGTIDNDEFSITYTDGEDLVLTIGSKSIILGTTPSNYEGKFIYNTNSYTLNNNQQELSISTVLTESFTTKDVYDKTSIVKILNTTLFDDNKSSTLVTANALDEALAIMGQASISNISSLHANYKNNDKLGNDAHVLTQESATLTTVNNKVSFDSANGEYINLNGTKVYKEATADNLGPVKVKYDTKNKTLTISTK